MKTNDPMSIFLCASCGWKKVCRMEQSGLHELRTDAMSSRKFRCPSCGRGIAPRKFPDPQSEADRQSEEDSMKAQYEEWLGRSMEHQREFLREKDGQGVD